MKVYLASSWRNRHYDYVLSRIRAAGYEIYDFRRPRDGERGFAWNEVDSNWQAWSPEEFIRKLDDPIAIKGFLSDDSAIKESNVCVLVLPCGRSAHLEAGIFVGDKSKKLIIYIPEHIEPELMYKEAHAVCSNMTQLLHALKYFSERYYP